MKLKITQPGWENYTGQLGMAFFQDGVSVADVPKLVARRLAGVVGCVWEDGTNPSVTQDELTRDVPAPDVNTTIPAPVTEAAPELIVPSVVIAAVETQPAEFVQPVDPSALSVPSASAPVYTKEELEAIADKEGIAGLRALADPLDIKSNSISALIAAMVSAGVKKG